MNESNAVVKFLNKATDIIVLNVLFILCCIPIVTIGASFTAMYTVTLRSIRYGDGYVARVFFYAFKKNFKQSTIAWVGILVIGAVLFLDYRFWDAVTDKTMGTMMKIMSLVIAFLVFMFVQWLFPLIAKMEDKLTRQIRNSILISIGCLAPYTLIIMGLSIGFGYLVYSTTLAMFFALIFGFALVAWIQSFFIYKAFSKFITEEPVGTDDPLYGDMVAHEK